MLESTGYMYKKTGAIYNIQVSTTFTIYSIIVTIICYSLKGKFVVLGRFINQVTFHHIVSPEAGHDPG